MSEPVTFPTERTRAACYACFDFAAGVKACPCMWARSRCAARCRKAACTTSDVPGASQ